MVGSSEADVNAGGPNGPGDSRPRAHTGTWRRTFLHYRQATRGTHRSRRELTGKIRAVTGAWDQGGQAFRIDQDRRQVTAEARREPSERTPGEALKQVKPLTVVFGGGNPFALLRDSWQYGVSRL